MIKIIAIVSVMVIINGFLVYTLIKSWERVNEKIQQFMLDKSGSFYVEKENENIEKSKEVTETVVVQSKPVYIVDNEIDITTYKNEDFKEEYKAVKENIDVNKDGVVLDVINKDRFINSFEVETLTNVVNSFSFDSIYELSTLSSSKQEELLRSVFDINETKLIDDYKNIEKKPFNCIDFFSYVKRIAKEKDPTFYVKTGWKNEDFNKLGNDVVTVYDDKITEGVKIVHKDKIYDYSI